MQLASYTLPDAQRYNIIQSTRAVAHFGIDGSVSRDTRIGTTTLVHRVQIGWEGLTEAERDTVMSAWQYMLTHNNVTFTDPTGVDYLASMSKQDRALNWVGYDGPDDNGLITAQFDIVMVLETIEY